MKDIYVEHTHIETIRQELLAVQHMVYMNTGTMGPLPSCTLNAIWETQEGEWKEGRIGANRLDVMKMARRETREAIARFIHADVKEIALTANTSEGINQIMSGFNWMEGDEVITFDIGLEHVAMLLPLYNISRRYHVNIKIAKQALGDHPVKAIQEHISSRTRLIAVSHVFYSTGELLPIEEIKELAHRHGIPVLVDGAQAVGAIPVDMKKLDVDFYSFPCQKWLCGPEGTGALYVKKKD